jgi:hypothetical protein
LSEKHTPKWHVNRYRIPVDVIPQAGNREIRACSPALDPSHDYVRQDLIAPVISFETKTTIEAYAGCGFQDCATGMRSTILGRWVSRSSAPHRKVRAVAIERERIAEEREGITFERQTPRTRA